MKQLLFILSDSAEKNIRFLLPMFLLASIMLNKGTNYFQLTIFGILAISIYLGLFKRIVEWNLKKSLGKLKLIFELLLFTIFTICYIVELLAATKMIIPRTTITILWIILSVFLCIYILITNKDLLKELMELF